MTISNEGKTAKWSEYGWFTITNEYPLTHGDTIELIIDTLTYGMCCVVLCFVCVLYVHTINRHICGIITRHTTPSNDLTL